MEMVFHILWSVQVTDTPCSEGCWKADTGREERDKKNIQFRCPEHEVQNTVAIMLKLQKYKD